MPRARGTFTVWYLAHDPQAIPKDRHIHEITAVSAADLMKQAKENRPDDMFVKAIIWQNGGGSGYIWYKVTGRSEEDCWSPKRRREAFDN